MIAEVHGATLAFATAARPLAPDCAICARVPEQMPTVDDVVRAVEAARATSPLCAVYLRAVDAATEDGGVLGAEPFVDEIKKRFDLLVSVDAHPPADLAWIDRSYAMGVDAAGFNLERWGRADRVLFQGALQHAASVFPSGAVTSHLVLGLDAEAATLEAIDSLAGAGVVPVLAGRTAPQAEIDPAPFYAHAHSAIRRHRLPTRWVRTLSDTPSELESSAYDLALPQGTLARVASVRLSDLRRLLRVKRIRDSLDSSGL